MYGKEGIWMQDAGYRIPDAGYQMPDVKKSRVKWGKDICQLWLT